MWFSFTVNIFVGKHFNCERLIGKLFCFFDNFVFPWTKTRLCKHFVVYKFLCTKLSLKWDILRSEWYVMRILVLSSNVYGLRNRISCICITGGRRICKTKILSNRNCSYERRSWYSPDSNKYSNTSIKRRTVTR